MCHMNTSLNQTDTSPSVRSPSQGRMRPHRFPAIWSGGTHVQWGIVDINQSCGGTSPLTHTPCDHAIFVVETSYASFYAPDHARRTTSCPTSCGISSIWGQESGQGVSGLKHEVWVDTHETTLPALSPGRVAQVYNKTTNISRRA